MRIDIVSLTLSKEWNVLSHDKDVSDALKRLDREGFISKEQYDGLSKVDDVNLDTVMSEVKSTKIGCGISFLPRETSDLLTKLKELVMDFAKNGTAALQRKILAVLNEHRFRKVLTKRGYNDILKDMNK